MSDEFTSALLRAQALQRNYTHEVNVFTITVKYDSYYDEYMEIVVQADTGRWFLSTMQCVYEDDYEARLDGLAAILNRLKGNDDEQ
jgi:hypothetical protein